MVLIYWLKEMYYKKNIQAVLAASKDTGLTVNA